MNPFLERIHNGIIKENPALVLMLGMCPTLAVTTSAINGFGMGISTTVVLIAFNLIISLLRKLIPGGVRLPAFIVIVASLVTVVELLMEAYVHSLYESLGIYIPLTVVNCIILGRAEAYASKNPLAVSVFDGIGMGLGFTAALVIIGLVREFLGAGTVFEIDLGWEFFTPVGIFVRASGAFLVLAVALTGLSIRNCDYGCWGGGSCVSACGFDAIHVVDGVAAVDRDKCRGCGLYAPACIGCGIRAKQRERGAITVEGNLARVNDEKCTGCGKCAEMCPVKAVKLL